MALHPDCHVAQLLNLSQGELWPQGPCLSHTHTHTHTHTRSYTPRLDFLAVQGMLKSLIQHHSSRASILWCSTFFLVQLSHPYVTTGKTIALTRRTFVGKVMSLLFFFISLLFNMLSPRLVIAFLPGSKRLLISWLRSLSAVILEPPKIKSLTVSIVSPSIHHEVMGPDATIFIFLRL